jgi:hypothetical protein
VNVRELEQQLGRRFARLATNAVVARPALWGAFRWLTRAQFDRLAPSWDGRRRPEAFAALERALAASPPDAPDPVASLGAARRDARPLDVEHDAAAAASNATTAMSAVSLRTRVILAPPPRCRSTAEP